MHQIQSTVKVASFDTARELADELQIFSRGSIKGEGFIDVCGTTDRVKQFKIEVASDDDPTEPGPTDPTEPVIEGFDPTEPDDD